MQTSIHDVIGQLQTCAVELCDKFDEVPLSRVITMHRNRYGLGVNIEWAAERIEHNGIVRLVERDGAQFVEIL